MSRVQDLIKEEVSRLLLYKVKDPRLHTLSVTRVVMTPDLKSATVYYSIFDDKADRREIKRGLEKAAGFFRSQVGQAANLRFVPELKFEYDRSLEYAQHMDKVLTDLAAENQGEGDKDSDGQSS